MLKPAEKEREKADDDDDEGTFRGTFSAETMY